MHFGVIAFGRLRRAGGGVCHTTAGSAQEPRLSRKDVTPWLGHHRRTARLANGIARLLYLWNSDMRVFTEALKPEGEAIGPGRARVRPGLTYGRRYRAWTNAGSTRQPSLAAYAVCSSAASIREAAMPWPRMCAEMTRQRSAWSSSPWAARNRALASMLRHMPRIPAFDLYVIIRATLLAHRAPLAASQMRRPLCF